MYELQVFDQLGYLYLENTLQLKQLCFLLIFHLVCCWIIILELTSGWHRIILATLTPPVYYTLVSGSSDQIWWPCTDHFLAIDLWLNQYDPCMICDTSNLLHPGQRFFWPSLVAIGISKQIDFWLKPTYPCMTSWPQQCISLCSRNLLTKFQSHRTFPSKLSSGLPCSPLYDL